MSGAFEVPFVQVVRFDGGGDGIALPVSYGHLGTATPDLRLACTSLPADAALVVVEDATRDARLVLPADARFFAYARVDAPDGRVLGGVCLLDEVPRPLDATQAEHLTECASLVADLLHVHAQADQSTARAEAETRFQALSDTVFEALFILDGGIILDANDYAAQLLGLDNVEALIGRDMLAYVPERLIADVRDRLSIGGRYEAAMVRADGSEAQVEVSAATFPHDGRALRVTAVRERRV
ncbi:MAG: PAS domain S-box protein [Rhodothermaceae bacterium]|nr:PAS domain S-box protein [Rhodothermaceae bacterium]